MLNFQILKYYNTKIILKINHFYKIKTSLSTKRYFIQIKSPRSQSNGTGSINDSTKSL